MQRGRERPYVGLFGKFPEEEEIDEKVRCFSYGADVVADICAAFAAGSTTKVIVKVNGTQVQFSDAAPLERKGSLMLPLRTIAQYLQIGITSDKKTERIVLAKSGLNVSFKTGAKEAKVGGAVVAFSPAAISVKNRVYVPISFFENVLGLTTKYDKGTHTVSITAPIAQPEEIVKDVTALLQAGEFQKLIERYFDDNLKQALPADKLVEAWKQAAGIIGRYIEVSHIFQEKIDEHIMLTEARLKFEKTSIRLILPMNSTGQLIGLVIQPVTIDVEKPHTVVEEELTIGKGTAYELGGTLTLPKGATSLCRLLCLFMDPGQMTVMKQHSDSRPSVILPMDWPGRVSLSCVTTSGLMYMAANRSLEMQLYYRQGRNRR